MKKINPQEPNNQLSLLQVAEIKVSYHPHFKASERPKILSSRSAYDIFISNWDNAAIQYREEFNMLLLNRGNRVLGIFQVSTGGIAGTVVDPKLVFGIALKAGASSIILSHNHPSGNPQPSTEDINVTKRLVEAGKLLDLPVLDHLIVTSEGLFYSFADEGLL